MDEREITEPVALTGTDGRLNWAAVGWTRTPLINADGIGRGRVGRGRNKRWDYWAVTTPTHIVAMTVSDIDYAAVHGLWLLDRRTGEEVATDAIGVGGGTATLPGTLGQGPVRARTRHLRIDVGEVPGGTRLRGGGPKGAARRHGAPTGGTRVPRRRGAVVRPAGPIASTGTGAQARAAPTAGRSASRSGAGGPTARDRSRTRSWSTGTSARSARSAPGPTTTTTGWRPGGSPVPRSTSPSRPSTCGGRSPTCCSSRRGPTSASGTGRAGCATTPGPGCGRRRRRVGGGRAQPLVTTRRTVQPSWSS